MGREGSASLTPAHAPQTRFGTARRRCRRREEFYGRGATGPQLQSRQLGHSLQIICGSRVELGFAFDFEFRGANGGRTLLLSVLLLKLPPLHLLLLLRLADHLDQLLSLSESVLLHLHNCAASWMLLRQRRRARRQWKRLVLITFHFHPLHLSNLHPVTPASNLPSPRRHPLPPRPLLNFNIRRRSPPFCSSVV